MNSTSLRKDSRALRLRLEASGLTSVTRYRPIPSYHEDLLFFMRQQRCGSNPFLDMACHLKDGRSFYGPMPDETFVDASGGWHDAGDQLKYLITASNATARMLLAYELQKSKFRDFVDEMGRERRPNGIPDVLDEAKWGLGWIHKLHPKADQLIHQVADDRDHRGFKMPNNDNADYGWGANSYRPVYFADGKPQGLSQFKSLRRIANVAGFRCSDGRRISDRKADLKMWNSLQMFTYRREPICHGKRQEGFNKEFVQRPYRYTRQRADDMKRRANSTSDAKALILPTLNDATIAALHVMAFEDSSMGEQMSRHYQMYPFTNVGHFSLHSIADAKTRKELAAYYRSGIERIVARGKMNPYGVGVPFLWCSNNLVVAFITQVHLYELMTGDKRYHASMLAHRDWLLGNNPWGTSMFEDCRWVAKSGDTHPRTRNY